MISLLLIAYHLNVCGFPSPLSLAPSHSLSIKSFLLERPSVYCVCPASSPCKTWSHCPRATTVTRFLLVWSPSAWAGLGKAESSWSLWFTSSSLKSLPTEWTDVRMMETPVFSACCPWTKASSLKVETACRAPSPLSALIYNLACLTQAVEWWEILVACLSWGRHAALELSFEGAPSPRPHPPGEHLPLAELWRGEDEKVMTQETQTLTLPTKM